MTVQKFFRTKMHYTLYYTALGVSGKFLRRFKHDFAAIAGPTLSDPARRPLRAGPLAELASLGAPEALMRAQGEGAEWLL